MSTTTPAQNTGNTRPPTPVQHSASTAGGSLTGGSTLAPGSNRLYDIAALKNDGSNFTTWKYRCQKILELRELWDVVTGTDAMPDPTADRAGYLAWKRRDQLALTQITLTLEDAPLNGVVHEPTAKKTWDKLMATYEGKGKQTIASLIREMFRGTLSDESDLRPQLEAMLHKKHQLTNLGVSLDDQLIAIAMVISLPPTYATLSTILMSSQATLTPEMVIEQVLEHETHVQNQRALTALVARTPGKGNANQKGKGKSKKHDDRDSLKCTHCGKKRHTKDECRKLKSELAAAAAKDGKKENTSAPPADLSAKVADVRDASSLREDVIRLYVADAVRNRTDPMRWIVDSGASVPMTSRRDFFASYRPLVTPKRVWLGDERFILAVGIGAVRLSLSDSHSLSPLDVLVPSVYHVPELNGNLLSVSSLVAHGHHVNFDQGGCTIIAPDGQTIGTAV